MAAAVAEASQGAAAVEAGRAGGRENDRKARERQLEREASRRVVRWSDGCEMPGGGAFGEGESSSESEGSDGGPAP